MNSYKTKLIILLVLISSILLIMMIFIEINNNINTNVLSNDERYIVCYEQLVSNKYIECEINNTTYHVKPYLVYSNNGQYIYSLNFKESIKIASFDKIIILNNKVSIIEYIFNYLKSNF